jgi:hypothetical protein
MSGTTPTLPLTPDARKAYEDLYAKNQIAIDNTIDGTILQSLNDAQLSVGGVLSADNQYRLSQDTALFNALSTQIKIACASLIKLRLDISGVESKIAVLGDVAAGINKVLTLVPAI